MIIGYNASAAESNEVAELLGFGHIQFIEGGHFVSSHEYPEFIARAEGTHPEQAKP